MARTGRPRGFDREHAVAQAMILFWARGYETTSLSDLRLAMGISSASFYAAFGSKESLYREVVRRYVETYGRVMAPLDDPTLEPREAIEATFRGSARMQTDPAHPAGCLLVLSANIGAPENDELRRAVATERERDRHRFETCVRRAVACGALAQNTPVTALATMFETFLLGLSVQAVDGLPTDRLQEACNHVMAAWDAYRPLSDRSGSPAAYGLPPT